MVLLADADVSAFGVRALFVPGVGLAALAIGAEIVVRIAAWPVQITREPRAASVEEGAALSLTLRVRAGPSGCLPTKNHSLNILVTGVQPKNIVSHQPFNFVP